MFTLTPDSPLFPYVAAAFALSVICIGLLFLSKDVPVKRVVLPVLLAAFSACVYMVVYGSGKLGSGLLIHGFVILAVLGNAVWVYSRISFCAACGATVADLAAGSSLCSDCAQRELRQ